MRRLRLVPGLTDEARDESARAELDSVRARIARAIKEPNMTNPADMNDRELAEAYSMAAAAANEINMRFGALTGERIRRVVREHIPEATRLTFELRAEGHGRDARWLDLGMLYLRDGDEELHALPGNAERGRIEANPEWEGLLADYLEAFGWPDADQLLMDAEPVRPQ